MIKLKRIAAMLTALSLSLALLCCSPGADAASAGLNRKKLTLNVGQSYKLKVKNYKSRKKIKWTSSNKKVVTVSKKGKLKARKKGTAKITAKSGKKKFICRVTVKEKSIVTTASQSSEAASTQSAAAPAASSSSKAATTERMTTEQTVTEDVDTTEAKPEYVIFDDGELFSYNGSGGIVNIPDGVKSIGNSVFRDRSDITSINMSDDVTEIGDEAFQGCTGLTSVKLSDNIEKIGYGAFSGCKDLKDINVPKKLESIGNFAFKDKSSCDPIPWLKEQQENSKDSLVIINDILVDGSTCKDKVEIPDGVKSIAGCAFAADTDITGVAIPGTVTEIGDNAFLGCSSLADITIPESVKNIGAYAFVSYDTDREVYDPIPWLKNMQDKGFKKQVIVNGILIDGSACTGDVTISSDATVIGYSAFRENTQINDVTIPASVTRIESNAFRESGIDSVTMSGVTEIGFSAFRESTLKKVSLNDGLKTIGDEAFKDCSEELKEITIPDSVDSIGFMAFDGVDNIYYHGPAKDSMNWGADLLNNS